MAVDLQGVKYRRLGYDGKKEEGLLLHDGGNDWKEKTPLE